MGIWRAAEATKASGAGGALPTGDRKRRLDGIKGLIRVVVMPTA
jgi:hypothetical protein